MAHKLLKTSGWLLAGIVSSLAVIFVEFAIIVAASPRVELPPSHVDVSQWDRGFVGALGTWKIEGDEQANPLQVDEIICLRERGFCYDANAYVDRHNVLRVHQDIKPIIKWDDTTLQFSDEYLCVKYIYTFDKNTKRLVAVRKSKDNSSDFCEGISDEISLTLSDGYEISKVLTKPFLNVGIPIIIASLIALWAFVAWRIYRVFRAQPNAHSA